MSHSSSSASFSSHSKVFVFSLLFLFKEIHHFHFFISLLSFKMHLVSFCEKQQQVFLSIPESNSKMLRKKHSTERIRDVQTRNVRLVLLLCMFHCIPVFLLNKAERNKNQHRKHLKEKPNTSFNANHHSKCCLDERKQTRKQEPLDEMLCVECVWFHQASLLFVSLLVFLRRERFISCSEQIETIPTHSMKDCCLMNGKMVFEWFP